MTDPELIRTANRLADNEGRAVRMIGLAVDLAGRRCVHLDRSDAIVPVVGADSWGDDEGAIVDATGLLRRHAFQNDPETGLSSLELVPDSIDVHSVPDDGIVRTAPGLHSREDHDATIEGMAYRSSNGNIVVLHGGLVYVRDLPRWDDETVRGTVVVAGRVRHGPPPPEAPPAGGSWRLEEPRLVSIAR